MQLINARTTGGHQGKYHEISPTLMCSLATYGTSCGDPDARSCKLAYPAGQISVLFSLDCGLKSHSTAIVMSWRSVNLPTLFLAIMTS